MSGILFEGSMKKNPSNQKNKINLGDIYIIPTGFHDGTSSVEVQTIKEATDDATAKSMDIIYPHSAWSKGSSIKGTIIDREYYGTYLAPLSKNDSKIIAHINRGFYKKNKDQLPQIIIPTSDIASIESLRPFDIAKGKTVLEVSGSYTSDATARSEDIIYDKTAWINGKRITGKLRAKSPINPIVSFGSISSMIGTNTINTNSERMYGILYPYTEEDDIVIKYTVPDKGPYDNIGIHLTDTNQIDDQPNCIFSVKKENAGKEVTAIISKTVIIESKKMNTNTGWVIDILKSSNPSIINDHGDEYRFLENNKFICDDTGNVLTLLGYIYVYFIGYCSGIPNSGIIKRDIILLFEK